MSKEAIELIRKQVKANQTEEVYLDDIAIGTISADLKKELDNMTDLMCLSMNNCNLVSLANFPEKPPLIRIELMENKFPAKELEHLAAIGSLQSLSLGSNKIAALADLNPLKKLENLIQLDLSETELAKSADYRKSVFELLPRLQVLDNLDAEGNEYEYSSENDEEDDEANGEGEDDGDDDDDENEYGEDDEEDEEGDEDDDDGEDDEDDEEDEEDEVPAAKRRR